MRADATGPSGPLRTELIPHRETIVLAAHGEIDLMSAEQLVSELREVLETGFPRVVLDLQGVSFIDSTGVRAILDAYSASRRTHVGFALIAGPPQVQRVFALTGLDVALVFVDPRDLDGGGR